MDLYFVNGSNQGKRWKLEPPGICIGREADNDIQLLLPGISRYHAKFEFTNEAWVIVDLGSTNGTRINGKKIEEATPVKPDMEIAIGEQLIRIVQDNETVPKIKSTVSETVDLNIQSDPSEKTIQQISVIQNIPVPQAEPVVNKKNIQEKEISISKISGNIFGRTAAEKKNPDPKNQAKKRISNLLFLLLVVVLACIAVLTFSFLRNTADNAVVKTGNKSKQNPLVLEYEKRIRSPNNIFRFYIRIENGSALVKLNDIHMDNLQAQRNYRKGIRKIDSEILRRLQMEIRDTGFMKITSDPEGKPQDDKDDYRRLLIGYGDHLNEVVVHNSYPKHSFESIELALEQFVSSYGLKTISLSEKEMREEAQSSFEKAEELLANYQAQPENLRNAIVRYQVTIDFLEQFDPKPDIWYKAKRQLSDAQGKLKTAKKDAQFKINVLYKKKQYAETVEECRKLMLILDPEDPAYQKIRSLKITLEKRMADQKKRRR